MQIAMPEESPKLHSVRRVCFELSIRRSLPVCSLARLGDNHLASLYIFPSLEGKRDLTSDTGLGTLLLRTISWKIKVSLFLLKSSCACRFSWEFNLGLEMCFFIFFMGWEKFFLSYWQIVINASYSRCLTSKYTFAFLNNLKTSCPCSSSKTFEFLVVSFFSKYAYKLVLLFLCDPPRILLMWVSYSTVFPLLLRQM